MIRQLSHASSLLLALAFAAPAQAVVVDWSQAETWHPSNTAFDRALVTSSGQTFENVAGTGLVAVVTGVGNGVPTPTLQGALFNLQDNTITNNPSITVTFVNGTADLTLTEFANLQANEGQGISNPDSIDMIVTQTAAGGGLMTLNGGQVPGVGVPVNAGASASVSGAANVPGTSFTVEIAGTHGYTWSFVSFFEFGSASQIQTEITAVRLATPVPALPPAGVAAAAAALLLAGFQRLRRYGPGATFPVQ